VYVEGMISPDVINALKIKYTALQSNAINLREQNEYFY